MRILKFGGTSLAAPERIRAVAGIVKEAAAHGPVAVVVSAFGGVTDDLLAAARCAESRDESYRETLAALEKRHLEAIRELAAPEEQDGLRDRVREILGEVDELVHGAFLVRESSARTLDRILGAGERMSAPIVAAALRQLGLAAEDCDARSLVVTGPEFGRALVREEPTSSRIRAHFADRDAVQVVTGFVAATEDGEPTTLGRGGSDYTASLLGAALAAEAVELWTDVDGVLSADPRMVRGATVSPELTYEELMELSHFGAKVVHPPSVHPTRRESIPLRIKNTFRPDAPGTLVTTDVGSASEAGHPVRGIASIPSVSLFRLEGDGMVGVPGIAMRLFGALARRGVSVIMISQASSEHSICFAVAPEARDEAAAGVTQEFEPERRAGLIDDLVIEDDLAVIAVVGSGMRERAGISGRLFGVLGSHGVNVRAVAQGSSELNISLVVAGDDAATAVNAIHHAFFPGGEGVVELGLAGVGGVGEALLGQLAEHAPALEESRRLRLRIVGVANSRGAVVDAGGIEAGDALRRVRSGDGRVSHDDFRAFLATDRGAPRVFVDCSASESVTEWYAGMQSSGASVVTANKLRLARSMEEFRALWPESGEGFYHETTVGAALPVVRTLADLVATGDRVRKIEGVLSGTVAFLLSEVARGRTFSESVRSAHELGYTEPDPREDLGGRDVARKILILARLAGNALEPDDVGVESLLPDESWTALSLDEFWKRGPELDEGIAARHAAAADAGRQLVYLASFVEGRAAVGLTEIEEDHPCAGVRGTDSVLALTTDRYADSPLVIRGPGAGPELTASGVFADVLRAVAEGGDRG